MGRLPRASVVVLALLGLAPLAGAAGEVEEARRLHERGMRGLEAAVRAGDEARKKEAADALRSARALYERAIAKPDADDEDRVRWRSYVADIDARLAWAEEARGEPEADGADAGAAPEPEARAADPAKGASLLAWCRGARRTYDATADPLGRAALARQIAEKAGILGLPTLLALFEVEEAAVARKGVRDGLVAIGGPRTADAMAAYAPEERAARRDEALEVIYGCLEKPEKAEPERPFCRAIRRFHERKDRKLTLRILERLDAMGTPGIAALGEVIYVEDFGYHDHTIGLLSRKRDSRAVPPLVFKMNRFKFEFRVQYPAHQALLDMGWHAVPELIDRLDDKAAGIWISWTLRKISGETMGTDKRKWHDWWKHESVRHPETFADPDERPKGDLTPDD